MAGQLNSYDSHQAIGTGLATILSMFKEIGVRKIVFKALAPNDNSKN